MTRALVVAFSLALVPAAAGAGAAEPVALRATPAHVSLVGSGRAVVRVTNSGTKRVAVDVAPAGFALDLRGRPRVVRGGERSAAGWLTLSPRHLTLGPRATASVVVAAKLPRRAEPGDHDALVLLSSKRMHGARVAVRLRLGVVVVVRAPGSVVRRIELHRLRVAHHGGRRSLEVVVVNRGNVTESLRGARAVLARAHSGRQVATLSARSRQLRPRTRGILEFPLRARLRGAIVVRVAIPAERERGVAQRSYRIRV